MTPQTVVLSSVARGLPAAERLRRRLVDLVLLDYLLLVLEGALRKWTVPALDDLFFFIRLPVTLLLYWLAFRHRRWPRTNTPLFWLYLLGALATLIIPLQILLGDYDRRHLVLAVYGWINYLFYVPLAFIIAEQFQESDLLRWVRLTLWLTVAAAPIVVWQFFSPASAPVNAGIGVANEAGFASMQAALGRVRPAGFFTSALGQAQFVAATTALLLAVLVQRRRFAQISSLSFGLALMATTVMIGLSGSRAIFIAVGLVVLASVSAGLLSRRRRVFLRAGVWPLLLLVAIAVLWPLLLPQGYEVFTERWANAMSSEVRIFELGLLGRLLYQFYGFVHYLWDTPVFGYLVGIGGNAAVQLPWVELPPAFYAWNGYGAWAEGGWDRHIVELGPILGVLIIVARILLTGWVGLRAAHATRRTGDVLPLLLFGYVGIQLLSGQVTGHGTVNGYAWMFMGFCLASSRISLEQARMRAAGSTPAAKAGAAHG